MAVVTKRVASPRRVRVSISSKPSPLGNVTGTAQINCGLGGGPRIYPGISTPTTLRLKLPVAAEAPKSCLIVFAAGPTPQPIPVTVTVKLYVERRNE